MADTFTAKALKGHTLRTDKGFLVFNEGEETRMIPEEYRRRLEDQNVIPRGGLPNNPPALSGRNKADLTAIAEAEGVTLDDGMTNAAIAEAIEAKRADATAHDAPVE